MKIYNNYIVFCLVGFLNQYSMDSSGSQLGVFVLSVSQKSNPECFAQSAFAIPGLLVKRGDSMALKRAKDLSHWESDRKALILSNKDQKETNEIMQYPLMDPVYLKGGSGGLAYYIGYKNNLPVSNITHSYFINHCLFATGVFEDGSFKKIEAVGGLYFKLKSVDFFLSNNPILKKYSTLLLPKDNEDQYILIKNYSELKNMPEKVTFVSSLSDVSSAIDKLSFSEKNFFIDTGVEQKKFKEKIKNSSDVIKNDMVKLMTLICTKLRDINQSNNNEIIANFNLFLTFYEDWCYLEEDPKEDDIVYRTLLPFICLKLSRTSLFKNWLEVLKSIFLNVRVSNQHKKYLINSLSIFINKMLSSQNNDFQSLSLMYTMIDDLITEFKNIEKFGDLSNQLESLVSLIKEKKCLLYITQVKQYQEKVEKIKIDNEELSTMNQKFMETYPILFSVQSIDTVRQKEDKNNFSLDSYDKINNQDINLKKINTSLQEFLEGLKNKYSNNNIIQLLNTEYGINSFEAKMPAKKFFELFAKTDINKKESVFLMFLYLHNTLEKNIFELDNPEFKDAWKKFILSWVVENSSFEPLALLLTYYSFSEYNNISQQNNKEDKFLDDRKQFYCNLFADVFISNLFNEPLLQYFVDILKNNIDLKDFFGVIVARAHQINNNYIKQYFFDLLIEKIKNKSFDLLWYEGIASLFFTFSTDQQDWYINNKVSGKKHLIYALIKFIYIKNKNDNQLTSLHREAIFSNGWLLDQDKLVVYQDTLKKLLSLLKESKIIFDESDYKKSYDVGRDYWSNIYPIECLVSPMYEYPEFLQCLLQNAENNKQNKHVDCIKERLEAMKNNYEKQIEMGGKHNNQYINYYKDRLLLISKIIDSMKQPISKNKIVVEKTEPLSLKINPVERFKETVNEEKNIQHQQKTEQLNEQIISKENGKEACLTEDCLKKLLSELEEKKMIKQYGENSYKKKLYGYRLLEFYMQKAKNGMISIRTLDDEEIDQLKKLKEVLKNAKVSEESFLNCLKKEADSK